MPRTRILQNILQIKNLENSNIRIYKNTKTGRPRKLTRRREVGQKIPLFIIKK